MLCKSRTPIPSIVLILVLVLTGCGKGVLDMQIVPPAQPAFGQGIETVG